MVTLDLRKDFNVSINGFKDFKADAPFSDFGMLIKNKMIDNPLLMCSGADELTASIEKEMMTAEKCFDVTKEALAYDNVMLNIDCVDTLCKCYINNELAFESNNAHIPVSVDVKALLVEGENTIKIEIVSAVDYITKRQEEKKIPKNCNGTDGAAYLRKPSCHFGWDWGPFMPYKYIGNVEINCYNKKIENIDIRQEINGNVATVTVKADNADEITMVSPNGDKIDGENGIFTINNPELWYTHDVSQKATQPLYTITLENAEMEITRRIGIRSIYLNQEDDEYGTNFQFVLNGDALFAKGASVIPFSAIPEDADNSTIDYYLNLCVKSNFNMIRIWGGGAYASDYLMDKCDELGILVWQDFCYACLMYPFYEDDFLANCLLEAETNVKRMTHHASMGLWCGNNELEQMFNYLPKTMDIMKAYEAFFYHQLPDHIAPFTDISFIPTSPLGDKPFSKNTADPVGDTHMWNVWHGLKPLNYYEKRYTRFLSEFGLESLPSMTAIKEFATKEEDFDLASDTFMSHQKCIGGNEKMMFYLKDRFDMPVHFEDLPYLTGIVQAECVKHAAEHFRRNKGRCNGALFWQLNDVWCCPSWSSVDFKGVQKAMMYMARDFFAPISVSYKDGVVYAHNDTLNEKQFNVNITVMNGKKTVLNNEYSFTVGSNSMTQFAEYTLKAGDVMRVSFDDKKYYFDNVKKLELAQVKKEIIDGELVLKASDYARHICIDIDNAEENYFSLLPGEEKRVKYDGDTIPNVKCENNIEFNPAKVKTAVSQLIYRLKPANIANAFYYETN